MLSIIGTAGRKDDANLMTSELYSLMLNRAREVINSQGITHLVSGGAAWSDHVAVSLFINKEVDKLTLHLPSDFHIEFHGNKDANIANYYHKEFSRKMKGSSLKGIGKAIDMGAEIHVHKGFFARNHFVAKSPFLLAFTNGSHSYEPTEEDTMVKSHTAGLKDGGTSHTWNNSLAHWKMHVCLKDL